MKSIGGQNYPAGILKKHRTVAPPNQPAVNARLFIEEIFEKPQFPGLRLIGYHRYTTRFWNGSSWGVLEKDVFEKMLWEFFDLAIYDDDGKVVPFKPSSGKVREVIRAIQAQVTWPGADLPYWTNPEIEKMIPSEDVVALQNGLLWISKRQLLSPDPNFTNAFALPFAYDRDVARPARWHQFLTELWGDDPEPKGLLQEWLGYLLASDTSQQKILLMVGPPRSGKGTIGSVIGGLLGEDNVVSPTLNTFTTNFGLQSLIDKPAAIVADARLHNRSTVVVERLLTISGEDRITIDVKHKDLVTVQLPTRLMILTNELPHLSDASGALASRFIVLEMTESFRGKENLSLRSDLKSELPGIFLWALDGLDRLRDRGFFLQPSSAMHMVEDLARLSSPVKAFVDEVCVLGSDKTIVERSLYATWTNWCDQQGIPPGDHPTFTKDLTAAFPKIRAGARPRSDDSSRPRHYEGIDVLN